MCTCRADRWKPQQEKVNKGNTGTMEMTWGDGLKCGEPGHTSQTTEQLKSEGF